ncbi:MAG: substrate-binding domain-containing protein [Phycisphaerales bacterium]|nr:substrate-binding domain-containing protein [Phycisphaerales bacterium]
MLDLEWPYKRHTGIFAGTQHYAQEQGWESTIDEYVTENLPQRRTKSIPYDGVIARATSKLAERAARIGLPVVNVLYSSPAWRQLPGVFPDFAATGRLRAQHLLARGLRRFAAFGREARGSKMEVTAFQAEVREAGFPCDTVKLALNPKRTHASWREHQQRIDSLMSKWRPPIGVFASSEQTGRMIAQMCRQRGWRVPLDVAIIAGGNEESLCEYPRPSLTSVELGFERLGYEAARLLDRLMDGDAPPTEPILLPPQGLVVRESTDFFAVEDPLIASALEFIASNSQRHQIGANDVARALNIGLRTLQRQFRKYLDRPISAEIQRVRIERAKRELVQSKRPIYEIARDVGFGRTMQMYKVFRRELGVTPREYRKKRRIESET